MTPAATEPLAPGDLLTLAVGAGLAAASGELAVLAVRKFGFHEVLHLGSNVVWMAPLNDALLFGAFGVVLVALAAVLGRLVPARVAAWRRAGIFACTLAATGAVVLAIPRLHPLARLVLALGLAARITLLVDASPRAMPVVRRLIVALAAVFALAGAALGGWHALRERRALAALPQASAGARNVLLIIWDTVRSSSLGLYGYPRPTTPHLERLAAKGVTFDWAFANAPWTLTAHASLFTGRFPYDLTADVRTPLDDAYPTVAERLGADGFVTAGFIANSYYCNVENGLARGFLHYEDFEVSPAEVLIATTYGRALSASARVRRLVGYYDVIARRSADDISAAFLRWLDRRPDRPFFAFLNYYDAHLPYLPPEPWRSRFGPQGALELWRLDHSRTRTAELFGRSQMSATQRRELLDAYEGAIAYLDDRLGLLLDSLDRRGLLTNTVVIVASDHGEHFGEHGIFGHNRSLYTQETRVPLVIHVPGEDSAAVRVATPVSLRELASTILDLARAKNDPSLPGASLTRFWRPGRPGTTAEQDTVLSQYAQFNLSAVAAGRYHLVRDRQGATHLFDLIADPDEARDLATTPEGAGLVASIGTTYRAALAAKPVHPADNTGLQR